MTLRRDKAGVAALEFGLIAPTLIAVLVAVIDFGAALRSQAQITRAIASSAEYATLAGQAQKLTNQAIANNVQTYAGGVSSSFLGTPVITAVVNQGAATGAKCCLTTTSWSCSTASGFTCADGSTPGVYITIKATYPFNALFPTDTYLVGKTLTASIVAPLQ